MLTDDNNTGKDRLEYPYDGEAINGGGDLVESQDGAVGESATKRRILESAAALFATKGFTETSIRELAASAGLKGSSIYNHFASKTAILEYMLDDYVEGNAGVFVEKTVRQTLRANPTVDGILSCLNLYFKSSRAKYFFNVLSMILQEQHRNTLVNEYVRGDIETSERNTRTIMEILKETGVIRQDADPDYWMKLVSCIFYTYSNRAVLGNGDSSPGYTGMNMENMLRRIFEDMLKECGV